ncbi:MAG: hypothetical protein K8T26_17545 [Lentisphaerae bacterium]|nr:hypothetical protein [Lentisphaerota bacterium]
MILTNGLLRLDFDDATGSLRQITNLRSGKGFLKDPRGFRLVKLIVPTPEHMSRVLLSHEAGRPRMTKTGDRLKIVIPELRDKGARTGVFVTVTVRLPAGSQEAFFTLEIRNRSPHRVLEAWFPVVGGRPARRGDHRDRVTLSYGKGYAGASTENLYDQLGGGDMATHAFSRHNHRIKFGPLPLMDLQGPEGGLSYNQYSQKPVLTKLVFENLAPSLDAFCMSWAWARYPSVEPGETWTSCEYGIGVHEGDWHVTADRMKAFLDTWWTPSGMAPAIREKIGMFHVQTHGFSGEVFNEFADLPAIGRDGLTYGVRDLSIWDNTASIYFRPDTGGYWDMPARRLAELKRALADLRAMGCRTNACVNWRLIVARNRLWKALKSEVQMSLFGQGQYGFACGTMDGAIYADPAYEQGSYALCQASPKFRRFARKLVDQTLDLGFSDLFIDQCVEQACCYATHHGHRNPAEAIDQSFIWIRDALRRVRARDPEAYVVAEVPELWNTQWADLWWCWAYRDGAWARAEVLRYVMPQMVPLWPVDETQRDCIAEAFATGSLMAIATRDMTGKLSDAPALARQIRRLAALRKATAPWVSHGTFRDDRGLCVEGGKGFLYTSGRGLAVAAANRQPKPARVKATVASDVLRGVPDATCRLHVEGEAPRTIRPVRRRGGASFDLALPAYGAGVLVWEASR